MKCRRALLWLTFCLIASGRSSVSGGIIVDGTFRNMGFEQVTIEPAPTPVVPWDAGAATPAISSAAAMPYWTVTEDSSVCNGLWGRPIALDETSVSLIHGPTGTEIGTLTPVEGNYAAFLSANPNSPTKGVPNPYYHSASISQTGQLSSQAKSIHFYLLSQIGLTPQEYPLVTLNGTVIPLTAVSVSGDAYEVAGDVSAFAGQPADLAFTTPAVDWGFGLDDISFSTSPAPVPEPASLTIFGLTGAGLLMRRRRAASL
jgi:hypothetical protein